MRVLIVDDEPDILNVISVFLTSRGYDTVAVDRGELALERIENDPGIGVVLLDVVMPLRSGMDILKEVTQRKPHPPVIMMTALAAEKIFEAVRFGAVDYVLKPLDFEALDTTLSAAVKRPKIS